MRVACPPKETRGFLSPRNIFYMRDSRTHRSDVQSFLKKERNLSFQSETSASWDRKIDYWKFKSKVIVSTNRDNNNRRIWWKKLRLVHNKLPWFFTIWSQIELWIRYHLIISDVFKISEIDVLLILLLSPLLSAIANLQLAILLCNDALVLFIGLLRWRWPPWEVSRYEVRRSPILPLIRGNKRRIILYETRLYKAC